MQINVWSCFEKLTHPVRLVGRQVVEDDVLVLSARHLGQQIRQERDELLVGQEGRLWSSETGKDYFQYLNSSVEPDSNEHPGKMNHPAPKGGVSFSELSSVQSPQAAGNGPEQGFKLRPRLGQGRLVAGLPVP